VSGAGLQEEQAGDGSVVVEGHPELTWLILHLQRNVDDGEATQRNILRIPV
jgi:hypothetical protein